MVWRLVWFALAAGAISYACYIVAGSVISARAAGLYEPTIVRDVIVRDAHHLSGMIMVPTPCDQLSVRTKALSNAAYILDFNTWREPSVECKKNETPRVFHAMIFSSEQHLRIEARVDGKGVPVVVLPVSTASKEL